VRRLAPGHAGRVFEGVMDPDERRVSGSFYTPAALVRSSCGRASRPCSSAGSASPETRPSAGSTTVSPRLHAGSRPAAPQGRGPRGRFRCIPARRAGGAGRAAPGDGRGAGRSAQARRPRPPRSRRGSEAHRGCGWPSSGLWLALVADDAETDLARIAPLPNLDGHVHQGDVLLDPLALASALGWQARAEREPRTHRAVGEARRALFDLTVRPSGGREAISSGRGRPSPRMVFARAVQLLDAAVAELVATGKDRDLFGRRRGLTGDERGTPAPPSGEPS